MPVTLAQAKLNVTDDVDIQIIDEFEKSNDVLNRITFDDAVSPAGGGATLTYSYTRQITQRAAAFRAINAEYVPTEATKARFSVDLKPLGGSFQVDRVLHGIGQARETAFQMRELLKASSAKFSDSFINGDVAVDANGFDGLSKLLTGTTTEYLPLANGVAAGYVDLTLAVLDTKGEALAVIAMIDEWLALMDGPPDVIYGNKKALAAFKRIAAWADLYDRTQDAFGRPVNNYGGIPLVDLKTISGANTEIIPTFTRDPDAGGGGGNITGLTDLYAVRFGLDGVHGVSTDTTLVKSWMPDFTTAGAVKTGEAELGPVAIAQKATKSAAVFRNLKVA